MFSRSLSRILVKNLFTHTPSKITPVSSYLGSVKNYFPIQAVMNNSTSASPINKEFPLYEDLLQDVMTKIGVVRDYDPLPKDRSHLLKFLPKSQEELPKRAMKDSFVAAVIPLSTDKKLQDKYVTFLGQVRVGRLLENMDMFAILIMYKHLVNPKIERSEDFPYVLVTAMVDRIDFTDFIPRPKEDIKISGHVSWAGRTSVEIVIWLEQKLHGSWNRITRALFVFAARDPTSSKPAFVNLIQPADEREELILAGGNDRQQKRFASRTRHVSKVVPDAEEQKIIHELYLRTIETNDLSLRRRILPEGCVWMSNATLSSVVFSHPEERNLHNTIFGGYIMRQAEDLSWVLCYMFSKYRPVLKSISDIHFQRPIAVSSLIQMHAHVVYTKMNYIQVITYVETYNPVTGRNDTTNTLHFTFQIPEVANECIPMTYQEAMMYIDGRRHFEDTMNKKSGIFYSKL